MKLRKFAAVFTVAALVFSFAGCLPEKTGTSSGDNNSSLTEDITAVKKSASEAYIIKSDYLTDRTVVAEVDATDERFGADPTGKKDSTAGIQMAIDYCYYRIGGGVVYLPAGNYRVDGRIELRSGITLLGDYSDPDITLIPPKKGEEPTIDYGTVIEIRTDKRLADKSSALRMASSSAIDGLTFYYPDQNTKQPIPYYYTVDCAPDAVFYTIRNVTLLNSYNGISGPESTVSSSSFYENVKGTVLRNGIYSYGESDSCSYTNIVFSPVYWAAAGEGYAAPLEEDIRSAISETENIGLSLRKADGSSFMHVSLDGFKYGIYNEPSEDSGLSGNFYDLTVTNSEYGIYAANLDKAYGICLSNSSVSATSFALYNITAKKAPINLFNTTLEGNTTGTVRRLNGKKTVFTEHPSTAPLPAAEKLFNAEVYGADRTGKADSSSAIQNALNDAGKNGGGVVYLPAGKYLLNGNLTVPTGTMLLGSMYTLNRDPQYGTALIALNKDKEFITVNGNGAGVRGLYIAYPENSIDDLKYTDETKEYPFAIKCFGEKTFVQNVTLIAASHGIWFDQSESFILDGLFTTVWNCGVQTTNSPDGYISAVSASAVYTGGAAKFDSRFEGWINSSKKIGETETNWVNVITDLHTRNTLTLFKLTGSENVQIINAFHYGALNFADVDTSTVFVVNCEAARLNDPTGFFFNLTGKSTVKGVNALCYAAGKEANLFVKEKKGCTIYIGNVKESGVNTYIRTK
ncbi:MAG: hypothetical protein IJY56_02625 [Clostridia bacterium]|nr:hypothetical protein [Clostridia bacterium]